ncbi:MAG: STAS domain-containing protein [Planctomycetes bacterium]|nr:STAS domain-containing protein [Planctomycetota bacterium]
MSDPLENDIGSFVESLTAHQRVVLQRILGESLNVLPRSTEETTVDRLHLLEEGMAPLMALLAQLRRYPAHDDAKPYVVTRPAPGHAVMVLNRGILTWNAIWEVKSHAWLDELRITHVIVDVSRLDDLTSSTIAWLVTLAQKLSGGTLRLRGINDTMRRALAILHLDRILVPE